MEKDAEILSVEKSRNPQDLRRGKDLSLKTAFLLFERQRVIDGCVLSKIVLTRGRVFLLIKCTEGRINESRFVMRAWAFVGRESGRRLFS